MRIFFIIVLLSSLLIACSEKDKAPEGIIPGPKMRELLWDLTQAGEFLNGFVLRDSIMDKAAVSQKWYDKIFQLHKVTKKEFDISYAYYNAHPLLLKEMLDTLAKKQVADNPASRYGKPAIDSVFKKLDSNQIKNDTLRRSMDSLKKKMIKKRKGFYKTV